jgi:hypothetical protein
LQATTQHLQPMHLVMSKWNRYCSPSCRARCGILFASLSIVVEQCGPSAAPRPLLGVSKKVALCSLARSSSGRTMSCPRHPDLSSFESPGPV